MRRTPRAGVTEDSRKTKKLREELPDLLLLSGRGLRRHGALQQKHEGGS